MIEENSSIYQYIKSLGILPKKKLGQNFLINKSVVEQILCAAGDFTNLNVLEIGAGPGILTKEILKKSPKSLTLIEYDKRFEDLLSNLGRCRVIIDDVLKIDLKKISINPMIIISNLPYNISVEILYKLFECLDSFEYFIFMFQKEVADRIMANKNSKEYGKLSVLMQNFTDTTKIMNVSPGSFYPSPSVTSTILKIVPKKILPNVNFNTFNSFVGKLFENRRKKLKNKLIQIINEHDAFIKSMYDLRAEDLSAEEQLELFKHITDIMEKRK